MRKPKEWWMCLLPEASDEMIPGMYAIGKMMLCFYVFSDIG